MSSETERMDRLISDFALSLENLPEKVHAMASLSFTDEDGYMTRRTLLDPEIPEDVFIDVLSSFFWVYVAEAGLDAEQTASLIDRTLLTALEPHPGPDDDPGNTSAATEFRLMAQNFMDQLQAKFGDVKSVAGVIWNNTLGDLLCSTRCTEAITASELSEVIAALVVSLVASGQLTQEDAKQIFAQAAARADEQYDGLQEYIRITDARPE